MRGRIWHVATPLVVPSRWPIGARAGPLPGWARGFNAIELHRQQQSHVRAPFIKFPHPLAPPWWWWPRDRWGLCLCVALRVGTRGGIQTRRDDPVKEELLLPQPTC